jgi:hypothetical protein
METRLRSGLIGLVLAALPGAAPAADTCNGFLEISYVGSPAEINIGDTVRMRLRVGTGTIENGTKLTTESLALNLDCDANFPLLPPCPDAGAIIEYEGDPTITTTCPVTWSSGHPVGPNPNQVVFTATPVLDIPADVSTPPGLCALEFDVKVLAPDADGSGAIEQLAGYDIAKCDNGVLVSAGFQTAAITVKAPVTTTISTTTSTTVTTSSTTTTSTTTTTLGLFTRTPGFWKNRPDLTLVVLTNAGGLTVCGQPIINVAIDDARSALEAMCVKVEGVQRRQLARQLMAASLNVAAGGAAFPPLATCNAVCADPASTGAALTSCIDAADDYNNSGDGVPLPFASGSARSGPCKAAQRNACFIINPASCAAP